LFIPKVYGYPFFDPVTPIWFLNFSVNIIHIKSYIYECNTTMPDGKYWLLIEIDTENNHFIKAKNDKPTVLGSQIVLSGTIDDDSQFVADIDNDFVVNTDKERGRYYFVYNYSVENPEYFLIENKPPENKIVKEVIEGSIWVDKYTGEIKFDPKKNREDQRHHALDAITIACTEQSFLQRLSTHNAQLKAKERSKLDSTEKFPLPWTDFQNDVKISVDKILVSYHKQNKVLTKNKKGYSVRGQLHDDTFYGKKRYCSEIEYTTRVTIDKLKFKRTKGQALYFHDIVDNGIKKAIISQINLKLDTIEKDLFREIIDREAKLYCLSNENQLNNEIKDIEKLKSIINSKVDKILVEEKFFLENIGKRYKRLKKKDNNYERSPVPIIKVKVKKRMRNALMLKELYPDSFKQGCQFVNPGSNHHVMIYKDKDGNLKEEIVTFWEVVKRQLNNQETFQLPDDGADIVTTLEINDMFILGLTNEEYEANKNNPAFLSKYLYRVQKVSSFYYTFRHHLASSINNIEEEFSIRSMKTFLIVNPIKF